jgi:hypothetical protein
MPRISHMAFERPLNRLVLLGQAKAMWLVLRPYFNSLAACHRLPA